MVLYRWWAMPGFPSNMMLGIEVHQTRESCFLQSESSLGVFSCIFTATEDWVLSHRLKAQIGGVLQWCLSFCRFVLSAYMINLTITKLVTSLTKALLHQLLRLASVENSVLLKCRKLRREDQETSDWVVSRILYSMTCHWYLWSSKSHLK